jgi:ubiquinone/menaquinone biosynthesis C-methylase UbiE
MFFPDRIQSIKRADTVLEIGPGGSSHPRADVLLDKIFDCPKNAAGQRGYAPELETDKKVVFYEGGIFPFNDKEFDYIICSHVLEHVEDVDKFISEINRVGRAGYFEYPLIYYDFLYNFPEHLSFIKRKEDKIVWLNKKEIGFSKFKAVNILFYESLKSGYTSLIEDLKEYLFEGFEWFDEIKSYKTDTVEDLILKNFRIPKKERTKSHFIEKFRKLF